MNKCTIAVDFDGTIAEDGYPGIGKPMMFAFETLKKLQEEGFRLILWTYRSGDKLQDAVDFCKEHGIEFYAVNSSYEDEVFDGNKSRKINAEIFIDDRNLGGFPGWGEVYQILKGDAKLKYSENDYAQINLKGNRRPKKKKKFGLF